MRKLLISLSIAVTILYGVFTGKGDIDEEEEEEPPVVPVELKDGDYVGSYESALANVLAVKQETQAAEERAEKKRQEELAERMSEWNRLKEERVERERIEKERLEREKARKKAEEQAQSQSKPSNERATGDWQTFEATYYGSDCAGCSGITATGIVVRNTIYHNGLRVIAVDPRQIPLGSIVEVQTPNESFRAIAGDTGGAIKGRIIDVLVSSEAESYRIGRHSVKLRIIK